MNTTKWNLPGLSGTLALSFLLWWDISPSTKWLLMGFTGAITWIEKITTKPVIRGIMLGLGLTFIVEGLGMMRAEPWFAVGGAVLTLLLFRQQRIPAMLILLAY